MRSVKRKNGKKIGSKTCHATSSPKYVKPRNDQPNCWKRLAASSGRNTPTPVNPSSGGTGSRLKQPSNKFSEKSRLRKVATPCDQPAAPGSTTCIKETESG